MFISMFGGNCKSGAVNWTQWEELLIMYIHRFSYYQNARLTLGQLTGQVTDKQPKKKTKNTARR